MPRQARLDRAGLLHHVMIRGIERRNIFRNNTDRDDLIARLSSLLPETKTICYAWSLMSNHAHFLLRSGPSGISFLMRKLLTGYAVSFNRRHKRTGQLFQNRYKSIICQEDAYFAELVRYIHLNPLRAGIVSSLPELDRFAYSGHSAIMGRKERPWQETASVLLLYGHDRKAYHTYMNEGVSQGRREDLSGGGLVRSLGGWSEGKNLKQRVKGDQRILGDSEFVMTILKEAGEEYDRRLALKNNGHTLETIADQVSALFKVNREDILSKGRRFPLVEARSLFCYLAVHGLHVSSVSLARRLGMSPSAIGYAVERGKKIKEGKGRERHGGVGGAIAIMESRPVPPAAIG
jgi:putative transposase